MSDLKAGLLFALIAALCWVGLFAAVMLQVNRAESVNHRTCIELGNCDSTTVRG